MGNKNSHDFTKNRSVSFDSPISRPWGKKNSETMSRPYSLATRSPDLSSRSYNSKALDNSHRARSLGSLNTPAVSYATAARPSPVTNSGLSRQSSSQSNVPSRPASATLVRQTSSQPTMQRQTSSQLTTPRQYSDAYLTDDLKKLYKAHDKSKAQALVDDIDPDDTSAQTLDRKLNALKNQRQQDNVTETKSSNGTIPRKSKKTKAPSAPPTTTVATLPRDTKRAPAPVANGKVKTKKKSAPVPPSKKYEYVEPLPPPPPLPASAEPQSLTTELQLSTTEQVSSEKTNDNNNNSNSRNSSEIIQTQVETASSTVIQASIQTSPTTAVEHPLVTTSQLQQANALLPTKLTAPKRRTKKAPQRPPSPIMSPKAPSTFELDLDSADDFIKAISPKSEQKEVSTQCDIPVQQDDKVTDNLHPPLQLIEDREKEREEPGGILKLYIDKNAVKESQRSPDERSPITEHEPRDEPQKRKQKVLELDDILVQTDEMSKPVLLSHKELTAITLENVDTNSITTENSDVQESRPCDEDLLTPRPEVGFSEDRLVDPPIMQGNLVSATVDKVDEKYKRENTTNVHNKEEAAETIEKSNENEPLDMPDHPLQIYETSRPKAKAPQQEVEVTIPQQEASIILTSATVSPNSNNSEQDQQSHSPTQVNDNNEKSQKKKRKSRSLSKLGKSMKNFVSSLGRSSSKGSKQIPANDHSDIEEPEIELANDNWVFSPKGAVKTVSRPDYNPVWVEETFRQPDLKPSPKEIEAQIDELMVGAVDLSDHEDIHQKSAPVADVPVQSISALYTETDSIQTDQIENSDTVKNTTVEQIEKAIENVQVTPDTETENPMVELTIACEPENENPINRDVKITAGAESQEPVRADTIAEAHPKKTTNSHALTTEPKGGIPSCDLNETSSSDVKSPQNLDNSETVIMENFSEDQKPEYSQAPHITTNGVLPHSDETETANTMENKPEDTGITNHVASNNHTSHQQISAAKDEGAQDVIFRAKPATVVHRAEPAIIKDDGDKISGSQEPQENTRAATPPRPATQTRSSLIFMTPKGYGATSSKYRPMSNTGSA